MSDDSMNGKHHEGDVAFIQSLAELLNASELSEISVKREYGEHDRLTVSLSKYGKSAPAAPAAPAPPALPPAVPVSFAGHPRPRVAPRPRPALALGRRHLPRASATKSAQR